MNKTELARTIAAKTENTNTQSARFVDAFVNSIEEELRGGGEVSVTGFGKLAVSRRPARTGVNPQTGQKMEISASRTPTFSAGRLLGDSVKAAS